MSFQWLNIHSVSRLKFQTSEFHRAFLVDSFFFFLKILSPRILCLRWLFSPLYSSLKCRLVLQLSIKCLHWSRNIASNASIYPLFSQLYHNACRKHVRLMVSHCVWEESVNETVDNITMLKWGQKQYFLYLLGSFIFFFLCTDKLFTKISPYVLSFST